MPAYNFKHRFAPMVESGEKRSTIRKVRKKGNAKVGDTLYLYVDQRTPRRRKLGEHTCLSVEGITIDDRFVSVGGRRIDWDKVACLARADGFRGLKDFLNFFDDQYGLPFEGVLIKW